MINVKANETEPELVMKYSSLRVDEKTFHRFRTCLHDLSSDEKGKRRITTADLINEALDAFEEKRKRLKYEHQ